MAGKNINFKKMNAVRVWQHDQWLQEFKNVGSSAKRERHKKAKPTNDNVYSKDL